MSEMISGLFPSPRPSDGDTPEIPSSTRLIPSVAAESDSRHEQSVAWLIARLTEAKERAEAESAAKSEFLAFMSHEIRTPINAILGLASVLRTGALHPDQAAYLEKIDTTSKYLLDLVNKVLDYAKIESGSCKLEALPFSVEALTENARAIVGELAQAKGIRLRVECDIFPPRVVGDMTRLQQVLLNYLSNAIKFTCDGIVTLRAKIQDETDDAITVRFEVEDTGIGIAQAQLTRIFKAYEQVDSAALRTQGGSGLGLAITARLAEMMSGGVGVRSCPGVGSTFWFTARLKKHQGPVPPEAARPNVARQLADRFQGYRVLVVEDDPVSGLVTRSLLEDVGLVVDVAEDGHEALRRAAEYLYAAVLMDMRLPGLDGLDTTRQLRRLPGYGNVPIVAVTANVFSDDRAKGVDAGINDFLPKPYLPELLYAMLLRRLER